MSTGLNRAASSVIHSKHGSHAGAARPARVVLAAFLLTFLFARIVVYLIMTGRIPDLYLYIGGTHIHHLNYGIILLAGAGAYLLFRPSPPSPRGPVAVLYGVGLALTFDEFGMWVHLGGGYWQRASFDAVVVIASSLGLIIAAPAFRRFRARHWSMAAILTLAALTFAGLLVESLRHVEQILEPELLRIEQSYFP